MGLFIKIIPVDFANESRDKRELTVVKELGHKVIVVTLNSSKTNEIKISDGWELHCRSTRPICKGKMLNINRLIAVILWAVYVKKMQPDFISGHDIHGLLIALLSCITTKKSRRPVIIYDAHEFESGRNTKRNLLTKFLIVKLERFLLKRTSLSIVVNESIATEMQKLHKLKTKPLVIRNVPNYWKIDESKCKMRRDEYFSQKNIESSNFFILMYHGILMNGRGIENLIRATSRIEKTLTVILGDGEPGYLKSLKKIADEEGVSERVLFHPYVRLEELWQYVGAADVGIVNIENICESYYYSLPNKLMENIQSETPVIGSDFPEIRKIINKYKIGLLCAPNKVETLVAAIRDLMGNKGIYYIYKENLKLAKKDLCWENEKKLLLEEFAKTLVSY
jgi:glycosyltransferase involved in cell wall biosynthesis